MEEEKGENILDIKPHKVFCHPNIVAIYATKDPNDTSSGVEETVEFFKEYLVDEEFEIFRIVIEEVPIDTDLFARPKLTKLIYDMNKNLIKFLCIPPLKQMYHIYDSLLDFLIYIAVNCSIMTTISERSNESVAAACKFYNKNYYTIPDEKTEEKFLECNLHAGYIGLISWILGVASTVEKYGTRDKIMILSEKRKISFKNKMKFQKLLNKEEMKHHQEIKVIYENVPNVIFSYKSETNLYESRDEVMKIYDQYIHE